MDDQPIAIVPQVGLCFQWEADPGYAARNVYRATIQVLSGLHCFITHRFIGQRSNERSPIERWTNPKRDRHGWFTLREIEEETGIVFVTDADRQTAGEVKKG